MAFAYFYAFRALIVVPLHADMVEFWFMMQVAMSCGFLTSGRRQKRLALGVKPELLWST